MRICPFLNGNDCVEHNCAMWRVAEVELGPVDDSDEYGFCGLAGVPIAISVERQKELQDRLAEKMRGGRL